MKSASLSKLIAACAVSTLPLISGPAQAGGCMFPPALSLVPQTGAASIAPAPQRMAPIDARLAEEMARIEWALRNGRITPYEAGRLMRQQWEWAQFQQGFLGERPPTGQRGACLPNQDALASLAPLAGDMARTGLRTASSVMRALAQEAGRLLLEPGQADDPLSFDPPPADPDRL
jgi:hypothetical protein